MSTSTIGEKNSGWKTSNTTITLSDPISKFSAARR